MSRFPYNADPLRAFDEIEADAMVLEEQARRRDETADVIEKMEGGSVEAVHANRILAKRFRRIAACLGYIAGRVNKIEYLNVPDHRPNTYGGASQQKASR